MDLCVLSYTFSYILIGLRINLSLCERRGRASRLFPVFADRIVNFRFDDAGGLEFEVAYRGFPDQTDNSWEPESECLARFPSPLRKFLVLRRSRHPELARLLVRMDKRDTEAPESVEDSTPTADFEDEDCDGPYSSYMFADGTIGC